MQIEDIYANFYDAIPMTCPRCHHQKEVPASKFKDLSAPLAVACPCGMTFQVRVIIRRFYRKTTHLAGTYCTTDPQTGHILEQGRLIVQDLSRGGAGLRTLSPHTLAVDDVLTLVFTLDNPQRTKIEQQARVRWVQKKDVGVEFLEQDAYTEAHRLLGFYLIPQPAA